MEGGWHLDVGEEDLGIARGDVAVVEKAAVVVSAQNVTKTHCGKGVTHTMSSAMLQASSSPASVSCGRDESVSDKGRRDNAPAARRRARWG